jgi:uncharacterized protein
MSIPHAIRRSGWVTRLRRYQYWCLSWAIATGVMLLPLAFSSAAQTTYPAFQDPYVNDYGAVLSAENERAARAKLRQFRDETGVHAVVLTINSVADYGFADASIEPFATAVFNTWGIGDANRNDGILILVAPGDRKVRIELGSGYASSDDRIAQAIITDAMLPKFRQGLMSQGTLVGIDEVVKRFRPDRHPLRRWLDGMSWPDTEEIRGPVGFIGLLISIVVMGIGALVGSTWRRLRKRHCPTCQVEMRRLNEIEDDQYLEPGQRREETLKSVDYDVWLCPTCGYHQTLPYKNLFSRFQSCPQCHHKTLSVCSKTLVSPTSYSTGTAEIRESCQHCDYRRTYTRILPRTEDSTSHSSSSSGSSGGGQSSGGGASGSW